MGLPDSTVTLTVERQGTDGSTAVTLTRTTIHLPTVVSYRLGRVGYIRLVEFNEAAENDVREAVARLKQGNGTLSGIVLDLRGNPGGILEQAVAISDDFLARGRIVSIDGRSPEERSWWNARAKAHDVINGLPMAVLINDGSASASEIVAGALQDHRRAVLLGTRSFGKGTGQTVFPLPAPLGAVILTMSRFYTPSGRAIQGTGIAPDIEINDRGNGRTQGGHEHEADLEHVLPSKDIMAKRRVLLPIDLSFAAGQITSDPPRDWPVYDPADPATDFQLQQALTLVRAMAARRQVDGAVHARSSSRSRLTPGTALGRTVPSSPSAPPGPRNHTGGQIRHYALQAWWSTAVAADTGRRWR